MIAVVVLVAAAVVVVVAVVLVVEVVHDAFCTAVVALLSDVVVDGWIGEGMRGEKI